MSFMLWAHTVVHELCKEAALSESHCLAVPADRIVIDADVLHLDGFAITRR